MYYYLYYYLMFDIQEYTTKRSMMYTKQKKYHDMMATTMALDNPQHKTFSIKMRAHGDNLHVDFETLDKVNSEKIMRRKFAKMFGRKFDFEQPLENKCSVKLPNPLEFSCEFEYNIKSKTKPNLYEHDRHKRTIHLERTFFRDAKYF